MQSYKLQRALGGAGGDLEAVLRTGGLVNGDGLIGQRHCKAGATTARLRELNNWRQLAASFPPPLSRLPTLRFPAGERYSGPVGGGLAPTGHVNEDTSFLAPFSNATVPSHFTQHRRSSRRSLHLDRAAAALRLEPVDVIRFETFCPTPLRLGCSPTALPALTLRPGARLGHCTCILPTEGSWDCSGLPWHLSRGCSWAFMPPTGL